MKRPKLKGLWVLLVAALLCITFLSRSSSDIFSVSYSQNSFTRRYLLDYTGDSTEPMTYAGAESGNVFVYVLTRGALSVRAGTYDVGLQYAGQTEGAVLKLYSSDYVSPDNSGGKVFVSQELDPGSTYQRATFELDQNVNSLYILLETTDPSFSPERLLLESWEPVYTDRYLYCGATIALAFALLMLLNWKKPGVRPFALGQMESDERKTMLTFVFFFAAATLTASVPLLQSGLIIGHDSSFHLARIEGIASALRSGQFPVRVHGETLNGYGYANSIFYPELLMYLPGLLSLLGVSTVTCYKFYVVFVNVLTVVLAYLPFKRLFQSRYAALALSVVYLLNPYRLICLYYRSAVGEFTALTFLPLVVYGLYAVLLGNRRDWPWLVAGATGLLQSHILTTELTAFAAALIVLVFLRELFTGEKRFLSLLCAGAATVLLNVWFLVPMLLLTITMHPMVFTRTQNPMGYASLDARYLFHLSTLTSIGPHPVGYVILFGVAAYLLYRIAARTPDGAKARFRFGDLLAVLSIVCAIATTAFFPWETILQIPLLGKLLDTIQFPYRLLSLVAVFGTAAVGFAAFCWFKKAPHRAAALFAACGMAVVCALALFEGAFGPGGETYETKSYYLNNMNNSLCVGQYEYLPTAADLNAMVESCPRISSENDSLQISDWTRDGTRMSFRYSMTLTGTEDDVIELPLTYIPNYEILIDGEPVQAFISGSYNVGFRPTAESGTVTVRYREPSLFRLSECVSLAALAGLCVGLPLYRKKRPSGI